jgi:hypothetical protein
MKTRSVFALHQNGWKSQFHAKPLEIRHGTSLFPHDGAFMTNVLTHRSKHA